MEDYTQVERDNAAATIEDAANNLQEAINMAIAALRDALREKQQRQPDPDTGNVGKRVRGCWYCNDDVMQVVDSPNKPPINAAYCGLCGRKLEVKG